MNYSIYGIFLLWIFFISCEPNNTESKDQLVAKGEISNSDKIEAIDTLSTFEIDDFPIEDKILKENSKEITVNGVISVDKVWFRNEEDNNVLVINLYTDYFRSSIFHFDPNNCPNSLIHSIELNTKNGELVDNQIKEKVFPNFVKKATQIQNSYFKTQKGVSLGDKKDKVFSIYGKPDESSSESDYEVFGWFFLGDEFYNQKMDLNNIRIAKNSFGHQVKMYFKKGKLVAQILQNNIP